MPFRRIEMENKEPPPEKGRQKNCTPKSKYNILIKAVMLRRINAINADCQAFIQKLIN